MEIRNCPRCGHIFTYMSVNMCPDCEKKQEKAFQQIKEYIEENPRCTMQELAGATEVSIKRILKFVREGRLEISEGMKGEVLCESCGEPITRGRFCDSCIIKINQDVLTAFDLKTPKTEKAKENKEERIHMRLNKRL